MIFLILLLLLLALLYGPQLWARVVLTRYGRESDAVPGTGGQFARHLLNRARRRLPPAGATRSITQC